jgi:hypothetical protein
MESKPRAREESMSLEKTNVRVAAYTSRHRIEGEIVLLKGEHLSDKLNLTDRHFEALLNARVYALDGNTLVHEAPYLAVNKTHLALMVPLEGNGESA